MLQLFIVILIAFHVQKAEEGRGWGWPGQHCYIKLQMKNKRLIDRGNARPARSDSGILILCVILLRSGRVV